MRFTIDTQPFGSHPTSDEPILEYLVQYTETGEGFSVIPDHGGILRQLVLGSKSSLMSVVRGPDSPQSLLADETYAGAFLYPFPSRIRNGIYQFEGEDYALPLNEPSRYNAIHGLVHPKPFQVVEQEITENHAQLTLQYNYTDPLHGYPFPFLLRVTYRLTPPPAHKPKQSCALTVTVVGQNTGSMRCPAAFGWHPYFTLNGEDTDDQTIELPVSEIIQLDDNLLPTGRIPFSNDRFMPLKDRNLDNAFVVIPDSEGVTTILHSPAQQVGLHIWQDQTFPYLVVYTPGRRDHIAIEPLTANVDAFNNGEGLTVLEPSEELRGEIRVWMQ
jgi:aldose 1-epimerase